MLPYRKRDVLDNSVSELLEYNAFKFSELFIDAGLCGVDAADMYGWTLLLTAVRFGNEKLTKLLLERGANPNAGRDNGDSRTPLYYALGNGEAGYESSVPPGRLIALLATYGADVNQFVDNDMTALQFASEKGFEISVLTLLRLGANRGINLPDKKYGYTALHLAVQEGYGNIIRMLLHAGASTSVVNKLGETPLHVAMSVLDDGRVPATIIKMLLEADPTPKKTIHQRSFGGEGKSPYDLAKALKLDSILRLFKDYERK
jgi:ankyrin repeat protein